MMTRARALLCGVFGVATSIACGLPNENTVEPAEPRRAEPEQTLSSPMPTQAPDTSPDHDVAAVAPLGDEFPWLVDLVPMTDGDPVGLLERLRRELEAAPDDLGALRSVAAAHLAAAVHGGVDEHDAGHHIKQAADLYGMMVDLPALQDDPDADRVVFDLAMLGLLRRNEARLKDNAILLIRRFPQSSYVAYVYLAFAEFMLERGERSDAIRLFEKARIVGDTHARAFSLHRLGLAQLRQQPAEPRRALESFVKAIEQTQRPGQPFPESAAALRTRCRRDLVLAFAEVGNPAKAPAFFRKVGIGPGEEDMVDEMLDLLAALQTEAEGAR